jgi:hypothetical protein
MARTRAHPPRRLATARGESEIAEARRPASPTPPPRRGSLLGYASGSPGLLGRRTPDHNPPPEEGLMLARERPYWPRWLAGLSTPPIHPSPPGVASGGYGRPGCRGSPPPATSNNQGAAFPGHWPATGSKDPPAQGESRMRGWLLHHLRPSPPRPPGRRLTGNGDPPTRNNQNTRHINRVEVGVGDGVGVRVGKVVGEVDGERRLKKTFISSSYRGPSFSTSPSATIVDKVH